MERIWIYKKKPGADISASQLCIVVLYLSWQFANHLDLLDCSQEADRDLISPQAESSKIASLFQDHSPPKWSKMMSENSHQLQTRWANSHSTISAVYTLINCPLSSNIFHESPWAVNPQAPLKMEQRSKKVAAIARDLCLSPENSLGVEPNGAKVVSK